MASTSATRVNGGGARIKTAATTLYSDDQSLIGMNMMKVIAIDLEGDNKSQLVKELEAGFIQLLEASEDCMHFSAAIQLIGNEYQPGEVPTDFKKLFDDEIAKLKASSSLVPQNDPLFRQLTAAIWNVHHEGQPMPCEEQEDIVVTITQCNILNTKCPLSGKPVTDLSDPVRSMDCKHIYDKMVIIQFLRNRKGHAQCPMTGCPKILLEDREVCDPLLRIEIDEMHTMSKQTAMPDVIEDFTELNEDEESD